MGLFFHILSAINQPEQRGHLEDMRTIVNTVQQVGAVYGLSPTNIQAVLSALGRVLRPALQQQYAAASNTGNLAGQIGGGTPSLEALQSFLTPALQQQIVDTIFQQTRLSPELLQTILPAWIPVVLGFLNAGAPVADNPILNTVLHKFLTAPHDSDVDLGEAFKFADRLVNPPTDFDAMPLPS